MSPVRNNNTKIPRRIHRYEPLLRVCVHPFAFKKARSNSRVTFSQSLARSSSPLSVYRQWYCYGDEAKNHSLELVSAKRQKTPSASFKGFLKFNKDLILQLRNELGIVRRIDVIASPYYKKSQNPYWPLWVCLRRGKGYMPFHADLVGLEITKGEPNEKVELFIDKFINHDLCTFIQDSNPEELGWEGEWAEKPGK